MSYWGNEEVFKFLELYRASPVIWDPKHIQHKIKAKISEAWVRISDQMGIDVADLKRKRDSLMASYRHLMGKKRDSMKSNGQGSTYTPCWIFFDAMDAFLEDLYNSKKPNTKNEYNVKLQQESNSKSQTTPLSKRSPSSAAEPYETIKRMKLPFRTLPTEQSNISREVDDECELYGRLLVSKLKKIPEHERQEVMLAIDSFIIDHSRNMRFRAHCPPPSTYSSSMYSTVSSSSSSALPQSSNTTSAIVSIPEVFTPAEPFCVIQLPKLEQEKLLSTENSSDPLNTSQEEAFSN